MALSVFFDQILQENRRNPLCLMLKMDTIMVALEDLREMLKNTESELHEMNEMNQSLRNSFREFNRREKAFVRSLPTIRRIKRKRCSPCPICLEEMAPKVVDRYRTRSSSHGRLAETVYCMNKFHADCIEEWLKTSPTCPMCRSDVCIEGGLDIGGNV